MNRSDSYVPFIISYPSGNNYELNAFKSSVCISDACNKNWILPDLVNAIIKKQY